MTFYLLIRGYNCEKYIRKCLDSVAKQNFERWKAFVYLDASTDNSYKIANSYKNVTVFCAATRKGVAHAMYAGLQYMKDIFNPNPEDPVGILDADDWLKRNALSKRVSIYQCNPNVWVTHGSFIRVSTGRPSNTSKRYDKKEKVRKSKWRASHFKTFRWKMFDHLKEEYFQKNPTVWLQGASDFALMMPLIELAGLDRTMFVSGADYYYRDKTNVRTRRNVQIKCAKIVRAKPSLKRLP